jgi:hypothetical protein
MSMAWSRASSSANSRGLPRSAIAVILSWPVGRHPSPIIRRPSTVDPIPYLSEQIYPSREFPSTLAPFLYRTEQN